MSAGSLWVWPYLGLAWGCHDVKIDTWRCHGIDHTVPPRYSYPKISRMHGAASIHAPFTQCCSLVAAWLQLAYTYSDASLMQPSCNVDATWMQRGCNQAASLMQPWCIVYASLRTFSDATLMHRWCILSRCNACKLCNITEPVGMIISWMMYAQRSGVMQ